MNVKEIIKEWLTENGYDGLYYPGECACKISELFPCGDYEEMLECEPGYIRDADHGEESSGYDWMIGPNKPKRGLIIRLKEMARHRQ